MSKTNSLTSREQSILDILSEEEIEKLKFPRTVKSNVWEDYLNRALTSNEHYILDGLRSETSSNLHMKKLYKKCKKRGFYVPLLSKSNGNCMFESLNYHNIGNSIESLRKGLAMILYIFKDYENFLGSDITLKDQFGFMNEIDYVARLNDSKTKEFHKYTYNIMCQDLTNKYSWTRLPTELLLRVISYLYKVEIIIINSGEDTVDIKINSYEHINNQNNQNNLRTIYLGQLGESHYLPIDVLQNNEVIDPMYYDKAKRTFIKWALSMQTTIQKRYIRYIINRNNINKLSTSNTISHNTYVNKSHTDYVEFTDSNQDTTYDTNNHDTCNTNNHDTCNTNNCNTNNSVTDDNIISDNTQYVNYE